VALINEGNRRWWALGVLSASLFMAMLDDTVVAVALPSIQADLGASLSQLEWVINAYAIVFAVLLLTGGKLADYVGRRLVFAAGLVVFVAGSLSCGLSSSAGALITSRGVQGIGAALMLPATLSIITATFPVEERGLAIGIWSGVSGVALAIGPLVGGLLAQHAGWEWIFFINVPVGIAGAIASFWLVQESRDTSEAQRLDLPGLVTSGLGIFLFTFALTEANGYGWTSGTILFCFVGGALALAAFVALELRGRSPMLDLTLFRNGTFSGGNLGGVLMFFALFGQIFFSSIYLQAVLGYSATKAGATFLVASGAVAAMAPVSGVLSDRIGARLPTSAGMLAYGAALGGFSTLDASSTFWDMFPWMLVGGIGFGLVIPAMTAAILGSVPVDKGGVASGVLQACRQLGGGLGVAVLGAIVLAQVGDLTPRDPTYVAQFVPGYQDAMLVGALVCLGGAVAAFFTIRRQPTAAGQQTANFSI
jgi:EmrB/QacA subfamily drug resistance transporter